jgi:hypothetical protein
MYTYCRVNVDEKRKSLLIDAYLCIVDVSMLVIRFRDTYVASNLIKQAIIKGFYGIVRSGVVLKYSCKSTRSRKMRILIQAVVARVVSQQHTSTTIGTSTTG